MCPIIFGSLELCRLNRIVYKIVFTLIKSSTIKFFKCYLSITPSVALLSYLFLCSVFKVQSESFYTLKIEQCKNQKRSDLRVTQNLLVL